MVDIVSFGFIHHNAPHTLILGSSRFPLFVHGNGHLGLGNMNAKYELPGGRIALRKFRDRVFSALGIVSRKESCPLKYTKIRANIFDNKRYSRRERSAIMRIVNRSREFPSLAVRFIDWKQLKTTRDQLQMVADTDIYISGPGTGLIFSSFLNDGSIVINLGSMEKELFKSNVSIPTYLEEMYASSSSHLRALYYNRCLSPEITLPKLMRLIRKAEDIARSCFDTSDTVFNPDINKSPFSRAYSQVFNKMVDGLEAVPRYVYSSRVITSSEIPEYEQCKWAEELVFQLPQCIPVVEEYGWNKEKYHQALKESLKENKIDIEQCIVKQEIVPLRYDATDRKIQDVMSRADSRHVPNVFHFVWISVETWDKPSEQLPVPAKVLDRVNAWKRLHPKWHLIIWTNTSLLRYLPKLYEAIVNAGIHSASWASDIIRYRVIAQYGGVYLDTDIVPLRSIPSKMLASPFTICEQPRTYDPALISVTPCEMVGTAVIAAPQGNGEIQSVAEEAVRQAERYVQKYGKGARFDSSVSGPLYWSKTALSPSSTFHLLPPKTFFPCDWEGRWLAKESKCVVERYINDTDVIAMHTWDHTWKQDAEAESNQIDCGNGHAALSCADCPEGNGASWCQGSCAWDKNSSSCNPITDMVVLEYLDDPNEADLIWNDEFNVDGSPDSLKWDYDLGGGGDDEEQEYTSDATNVKVNKGVLRISATKRTSTETGYTCKHIFCY